MIGTRPSADRSPLLAAVLAGGHSRRMGTSKATVQLGGRPMIEYPLAALAAAGTEAVVVAKAHSALPRLNVPTWIEPPHPAHPLCGILAALRRSAGPVLVVGCDLPFLSARLVAWVGALPGRLVVPSTEGFLHPLLARYDPSLEPALEEALERTEPLQRVVAGLHPRIVTEREIARFGPPERLLFNVNTRDDLALAEGMLNR